MANKKQSSWCVSFTKERGHGNMPVTIQPTTLKYKDQNGTWHQADCLRGETGATPAFTIGTVTDVPYGTGSSATITGTAAAPVLNLQLQRGQSGNETIDDTKGNGDTDFVWSASKTYNEVNGLKSVIDSNASCVYQPDSGDLIANENIATDTYFMGNNTLYKSTEAIAQGETINPATGGNCVATSVVEVFNSLLSADGISF